MIVNMHVGDTISIWDLSKDGKVRIRVGQCKDPLLVSIYGTNGMEYCIVVTIVSMVKAFEEQRLFFPTPVTRYCGSSMGNDCFWLARDVFHVGKNIYIFTRGRHSK